MNTPAQLFREDVDGLVRVTVLKETPTGNYRVRFEQRAEYPRGTWRDVGYQPMVPRPHVVFAGQEPPVRKLPPSEGIRESVWNYDHNATNE